MAVYAERDAVELWAAGLSTNFLQCRELGHNWRPSTARQVERTWERVLRCSRCRCERIEVLSLRGEILAKSYHYPEGYLAGKLGRVVRDGRDALRLESVMRSTRQTTST